MTRAYIDGHRAAQTPPLRLWEEGAPFVLLAAPAHLFFHMRGVYRTSVLGALARMAVLGVLSACGFIVLLLLLVLVGLNAMGPG